MEEHFGERKQDEQYNRTIRKPIAVQVVADKSYTDKNNTCGKLFKVTWRDVYPQILCSLISFLFNLHVGIYLVYANVLIQHLDKSTAGYIVSLGAIATAVGVVISGPIADKFGRKNAHIVMAVPCISSWTLFAVADISQVYLLLTARLLGGLTTGLTIASMVFVAEIAHKDYRGMLLSLMGFFGGFGTFLMSIIASFLDWNGIALVFSCTFVLVTLCVIIYLPETPFWLLNFDDYNEQKARKNLEKLNPNPYLLEEEWSMLQDNYKRSIEADVSGKAAAKWNFSDPTVYKPICLLIGLITLQQLTGSFVSLYYFRNIVPLISPLICEKFDKEIFVIFGTVRFISNMVACIMAKNIGRRVLLMLSASGMSITCALLIVLLTNQVELDYQEELRLVLFLCFIFSTGIGVLIGPWTVSPELLPPIFKGVGSSFMIGYSYFVSSVYSQPLPYFFDETAIVWVFTMFVAACLAFIVYTYIFLPETLGKTIQEINEIFRNKSDQKQQPSSSLPPSYEESSSNGQATTTGMKATI